MKQFPQRLLDNSGCETPEEYFAMNGETMQDSIQPVICCECGHEEAMAEPDCEMECSECGEMAYGLETLMMQFLG
jgi:hypothetical protein